jgi:putative nucleotidyltransferase with HDIG domain
MNTVERLEALMLERPDGWWQQLCAMVPELRALDKTPQPPEYHAEGDVGVHTRLAVENCPAACDPDLRWIALLHDIAKPATTRQDETGRITAHGHARLGAAMAEAILARIDMPQERRRRIAWAIRHHMFHHSWQLRDSAKLTGRQRRYLTDPDFPLLLEFMLIDAAASRGSHNIMPVYTFYRQLWRDVSGS